MSRGISACNQEAFLLKSIHPLSFFSSRSFSGSDNLTSSTTFLNVGAKTVEIKSLSDSAQDLRDSKMSSTCAVLSLLQNFLNSALREY
ncbi:hypothetical protein AVEN_125618-1 [Araneus ventricosus]|uniref:Uncharacterized protein n=1 Tax=Araneus ventricosus TaxID=182803 RepID=A0A4Y2CK21_ARAVE|nr:hypothetical protein AVEN_125618-1 [Araneus ventricosus]